MTRTRSGVQPPRIDSLHLQDLVSIAPESIASDGILEGAVVQGGDVTTLSLSDVSECAIEDIRTDVANLVSSRFSEVLFERAGLTVVSASRSRWSEVQFSACRLGSAELYESEWRSVIFDACKIGYLNLAGSTLRDVMFRDCQIKEVDLTNANIERLAFPGSVIDDLTVGHVVAHSLDIRQAEVHLIQGVDISSGLVISPSQLVDLAPALARMAGISVVQGLDEGR